MPKGTHFVFASGHQDTATLRERNNFETTVARSFGWLLFGVDEGGDALAKLVKDATSLYGRKALVNGLRKELREDANMLPTVRLLPAPTALGRGALDLELEFPAPWGNEASIRSREAEGANKKSRGVTAHALLMSDGKAAWLAFGGNHKNLIARLEGVKTKAPESGTLRARSGLDALRAQKAVAGGFLSLSSFFCPTSIFLGQAGTGKLVQDFVNALTSLPHKGETPMLGIASVTAGAGPRADFTLSVPQRSFEDIGAILRATVHLATDSGRLPWQSKP